MSDTSQDDWATDVAPPPKKKGLPSWLLFCGGGCLVAVVLAVIGVFLLVDTFKDAINPEAQWTALEEAVDMDARPNEMMMGVGIGAMGTETWTLVHDSGYMVMIIKNADASHEEREKVFSGDAASVGAPGISEIKNLESGLVEVQGREIQVARFENKSVGSQTQQCCFVDITPEGGAGMVLFYIFSDGQSKDETPISDEFVKEVLKPFIVGPDREIYVPNGPHPQLGKTTIDMEQTFQPQIKKAKESKLDEPADVYEDE